MGEHYTRNTVEARAWCKKCQKQTMHRIDGVRLGPCLACIAKLEIKKERFEERAGIMEFEGNMSRPEAEKAADEECRERARKGEL